MLSEDGTTTANTALIKQDMGLDTRCVEVSFSIQPMFIISDIFVLLPHAAFVHVNCGSCAQCWGESYEFNYIAILQQAVF